MLTTLLLFAALVLVLVEIVRAHGKNGLTTWAVMAIAIALLVPLLRSL